MSKQPSSEPQTTSRSSNADRPSADRRRYRVFAIVAVTLAMSALTFLAMSDIGDNLVYYWSPTELYEAGPKAVGASIRLGGLVAPGSISRDGDSLNLEFDVTDGTETVHVTAQAVPPAMFREGIGVVVEGTLSESGSFTTERLMVKHDNEYQAPETDDPREMEELMKSMQFEGTPGR